MYCQNIKPKAERKTIKTLLYKMKTESLEDYVNQHPNNDIDKSKNNGLGRVTN